MLSTEVSTQAWCRSIIIAAASNKPQLLPLSVDRLSSPCLCLPRRLLSQVCLCLASKCL